MSELKVGNNKHQTTMENNTTFEIALPLFTGFYSTIFEIEVDEEEELEDGEYFAMQDNAARHYCSVIEKWLVTLGLAKSITFQKVYRPKCYNYSNDEIHIEIEINPSAIAEYMKVNGDKISPYIEDVGSSRPGYIPFYSDMIEDWSKDTEGFTNFQGEETKLCLLLGWILNMNGYNDYKLQAEYYEK